MLTNMHPLSTQLPPEATGLYEVQGFPGDDWRRLRWSGEGFQSGLTKQLWWKWRPVQEEE
jgi:hypothetical protein